ncbi:MAG TPA: adenylosuccinate synthetase [Candidatus Nanoarchaeia archaeon]|nr:adenylosuccinate synthetase [Candidatus Nanoarchaeia archaeon]
MTDYVVLGMQWGDEGKGRVVDKIANNADVVVRYQGGANSGHTLWVKGEKWVCHTLPDGILRNLPNLITRGVVLDLHQLFAEGDELTSKGVKAYERLNVSHAATIVLARDKAMETLAEENGSTKRGIRFAYERHARPRHNLLVQDFYRKVSSDGSVADPYVPDFAMKIFSEYADDLIPKLNAQLERLRAMKPDEGLEKRIKLIESQIEALNPENEARRLLEQAERLMPLVIDTGLMIRDAVRSDKRILYAGAQAVLLSRECGPGDDLTASLSSGAGLFADIGYPYSRKEQERLVRLGVVKHLPTRVGRAGHGFPTKDLDLDKKFAVKGNEFGATTGRNRELGHPDAVAVAYAIEKSGVDGIVYTKADLVDGELDARIAVKYSLADGTVFERMPTKRTVFDGTNLHPEYLTLPGWDNVRGVKNYDELPIEFKMYLAAFSEAVSSKVGRHIPILGISTSPDREDFIDLLDRLR